MTATPNAHAQETGADGHQLAVGQEVALILPLPVGDEGDDLRAAGRRLSELAVNVRAITAASADLEDTIDQARRAAQAPRTLGVLWLGEWHGARTLFLYDSETQRTLERALPRGGNAVAEREELAIVVRATVGALIEGSRPEMGDVEASPGPTRTAAVQADRNPTSATGPRRLNQEPSPTPRGGAGEDDAASHFSATAKLPATLGVRLGYAGSQLGSATTPSWQSGLSLGVRLWLPHDLHSDLSYAIVPDAELTLPGSSAQLQRHPTTLALGRSWHTPAKGWHWVALEGTLSADLIVRTTSSTTGTLEPNADTGRWLISAGVRGGAAWRLLDDVSVYGLLGVDAPLNPFDYVVRTDETLDRAGPAQFRMQIDLGAELDLL